MQSLLGKRILFATVPGDGHFNPLTGLAKHLLSLGCDVKWYTSPAFKAKLDKLGIPLYPFTKALDVPSDKIDEVFPQRKAIKNQISKLNFDMINYFILRSTEYLADIKDIDEKWPIDVVVADCVFSAIPFIKGVMKIPVVSIGVLPLIETSKDLAPAGLGMEPSDTFLGRLKQDILKKVANKILFKKPNELFFSIMKELNVPHKHDNVFDILVNSADLFLQNGTPGLEYKRSDLGKNIRFLGPLLPYSSSGNAKPKWHDDRLGKYKKTVLVTQGTVEKDVNKILVPAIEAYKNTDTLLVVTTGGSDTEMLQQKYPYDNVIISDFIAFDDVMPHVDAFISNGGFGGVIQGIQHGLPCVVAGVHEGKNEICARIGFLKYGVNLKTETPKPQQLKDAVDKIYADNSYKSNVMKLKAEFLTYNVNELFARHVAASLN